MAGRATSTKSTEAEPARGLAQRLDDSIQGSVVGRGAFRHTRLLRDIGHGFASPRVGSRWFAGRCGARRKSTSGIAYYLTAAIRSM